MAETEAFRCSVVTPERIVLECEARFVAFAAHDGEMGVLRNRAPLVCRLGIGSLRIETAGETHLLFIDGGFAQVLDNRLTLLTEQAVKPEDLDLEEATAELATAEAMVVRGEASLVAREKAVKRAQVKLRLASP